jgi:hypothetical protein
MEGRERAISISRSDVFQVDDFRAKGWCGRRRPDVVKLRSDPDAGVTFVLCLLVNRWPSGFEIRG